MEKSGKVRVRSGNPVNANCTFRLKRTEKNWNRLYTTNSRQDHILRHCWRYNRYPNYYHNTDLTSHRCSVNVSTAMITPVGFNYNTVPQKTDQMRIIS